MTQRPHRRNLPGSVGELFERARDLERLHHGPWIYVGSGTLLPDGFTSPPFLNSWTNQGGGLQEMRFRWLHGGGVEIQGSVTGGAGGSVIFTPPNDPIYLPDDGEVRFTALNDSDELVSMAIHTNGDVQHRAG